MASIRWTSAGKQLGLRSRNGRPASVLAANRFSSSPARSYSALSGSSHSIFSNRVQKTALGASIVPPRHLSTATNPTASSATPSTTPSTQIAPDNVPAAASTTPKFQDDFAASLDALPGPTLDPTPHSGYLKELGLDYGWGPTSIVEWTIETIQVQASLPMWAAVVSSVLLTRIALLPVFIRAADTTGRIATMGPLIKELGKKVSDAQASGNTAQIMVAQQDMKAFFAKAEIKYRYLFMPMLIQGPLGYGMFKFTRGMAALPLPELQTTSFLWLTDLTVADPYYLLPMITSTTIYFTLKAGGEQGETSGGTAQGLTKFLRIGVPTISMVFGSFFPAITQIGFFAGSMWGFCQARLFKLPNVRRYLGMHPLPVPGARPAAGKPSSQYAGTITTTARVKEEASKPSGLGAVRSKFAKAIKPATESLESIRTRAKEIAERQEKKHGHLTSQEVSRAAKYEASRRRAEQAEKEEQEEIAREQRARRLSRKYKS